VKNSWDCRTEGLEACDENDCDRNDNGDLPQEDNYKDDRQEEERLPLFELDNLENLQIVLPQESRKYRYMKCLSLKHAYS
jgi:hypothetical protein